MAKQLSRTNILSERLGRAIKDITGTSLLDLLGRLSSSERRMAGALLSAELLPTLTDEAFWPLFLAVVPTHSKAYLITFIKAWLIGYKRGLLTLNEEAVITYSTVATDIDRKKMASAILSSLLTPEEVGTVVNNLLREDLQLCADLLIKAVTLPALYRLFLLLCQADTTELSIRRIALQLMNTNTPRAMRLAEIIQRYFALSPLPGRFSVTTETYRLSRLDLGYESFCKELSR